ncbi:MAG: pseudouridine synthase, partial [Planctomycetota bacterium]
ALKKDGEPLYKLARAGRTVARAPRPVTVHALAWQRRSGAELDLSLAVSSGFYVRALAHELGAALGCGAAMAALCRTAIGPYRLDEAIRL